MSYPPQNLSAISDASPATPNAHAGDHTEARTAINTIVAMLGSDISAGGSTLQQRLEAIELLLEMAPGATVDVAAYPPVPLEARTDASPATPGMHAADHTNEREAINAIVAVLGDNPQGYDVTLQARIERAEDKLFGR
jgi:hypothetical protein